MKYWTESVAVTRRILTDLLRRRRSLWFWLLFPVTVLLLNGYILAERSQLPLSMALKFAAPSTLIGAAFFFSCVGGTVAVIVSEREQQTLKRLFLSPLSGTSYFLGICGAQGTVAIGQSLAIYILSACLGAACTGSLLLAILILLLSIMSYVGAGFILGTQLAQRTEDVNTLIATFGVPLLIVGGAFFPTQIFPDKLLQIARFNPIFHMNESLVKVWAEGAGLLGIGWHFSLLCSFAVIAIASGWLSYQKMLAREKRL
ncbi:MAG: ABC transporter permease [Cyanobacteria bacterium SBLK]|nr:ABC transporter permease [Cyanobacteria bacterium SBLK]